MNGRMRYAAYTFSFPAREPPAWAPKVERWYQLDAFAFGLPQAVSHWGLDRALQERALSPPAFLILASPEGSNRTDFDFAQSFLKTGTGSPSKFVHTLPNSRSASLLQVLGWSGPLLCLQNDPATFVTALEEAMMLSALRNGTGWVLGITRDSLHGDYHVHLFEITPTSHLGDGVGRLGHGAAFSSEFRWQAIGFEVKSTLTKIHQVPRISSAGLGVGLNVDPSIDANVDPSINANVDPSINANVDRLRDDRELMDWLKRPATEFKRACLGLQKGLSIEKQ